MTPSPSIMTILGNLARARLDRGLSTADVETKLILGPGWVDRFESGATVPPIDVLLAIAGVVGMEPAALMRGVSLPAAYSPTIGRVLSAEATPRGLLLRFPHGRFNASHLVSGGSMAEYDEVLRVLRDRLAARTGGGEVVKADAVAIAFLRAIALWPRANPSDLWYFFVNRAYLDPYNHPASDARLDFGQSWKRTGGWALEEVLVRHYAPLLEPSGIQMRIRDAKDKDRLLGQLSIDHRLENDKVDVLLTGMKAGQERCFGVVHVKSSFAERRTDDVPLSQALVRGGYASPLWTMDAKAKPAPDPINKGELGIATGNRSAKRRDIEDDGYFSACFSYNKRTEPTPADAPAEARIHVLDFNADSVSDAFVAYLKREWERHSASHA